MKMVGNYGSNWKRNNNVQLVSLACGLALAAVAIVGGNELLRDKNGSAVITPARVAESAGPVIDPTDLGSLGIEHMLAQRAANAAGLAFVEEARGIGQPGEGTQSVDATFIDPTDFASSFASYRAPQQFGTQADAVYAAESWRAASPVSPLHGTWVEGVNGLENKFYVP
jgi:hypothetical protein